MTFDIVVLKESFNDIFQLYSKNNISYTIFINTIKTNMIKHNIKVSDGFIYTDSMDNIKSFINSIKQEMQEHTERLQPLFSDIFLQDKLLPLKTIEQ